MRGEDGVRTQTPPTGPASENESSRMNSRSSHLRRNGSGTGVGDEIAFLQETIKQKQKMRKGNTFSWDRCFC